MLVREVMSAPVVTVTPQTSTKEALRLLDEYSITALPVVDTNGRIVGVVSEADLLSAMPHDTRVHMVPSHLPVDAPAHHVEQVMSRHPMTVSSYADVADAVELMTSTFVKSLPVVDNGQVVGVISRRDVVHLLARDDERIRAEVDELLRETGTDWLVEVADGVVTLTGPSDVRAARIAEVIAASVAGVVAVTVN